jgi:hypothetical protein
VLTQGLLRLRATEPSLLCLKGTAQPAAAASGSDSTRKGVTSTSLQRTSECERLTEL